MQVRITKWGNGLGIRIPKRLAARIGLKHGSWVEMSAEGSQVLISAARPLYTLDELLVGMTPDAMREAFAWGPDRGREGVA